MSPAHTIIVVNDFARIVGGAAKVAIGSAVALARRGHRVILYSGVGPIEESLQDVPNLHLECLGQHDILGDPNRLRAATSGIWNRAAARALRGIIDKYRADSPIVHFHPWVKALSPSVFSVAQECGVPSLITLHDYFLACPNGGFFDYRAQTVCKRSPLGLSCIACNCDARNYYHKIWRVGRSFVQRDVARCPRDCKNFVAVSPESGKILRPFLPQNANIDIIRCPIEVDLRSRHEPSRHSDFLFVGRFSPEKGALDFARAAAETGLGAIFIGLGEDEQKIRDACPQAQVVGWQPSSEVLNRMRQCRALVFPSRWYETQGLVAIEACAVGLPVIYSDVTVAAADLKDGINGLSYESGNVEALGRALRRLASDDQLTNQLGKAAYDWYWSDPWTMERHVTQLEGVYDRIRGSIQHAKH